MKTFLNSVVVVAIAAGIGAGVYYWMKPQPARPPAEDSFPAVTTAPSPAAMTTQTPAILHPLPPEKKLEQSGEAPSPILSKPVPTLDESDDSVLEALKELFGQEKFEEIFNLKDFVRRVVVSIDASMTREIPHQSMVVRPVDGTFLVDKSGDQEVISPRNYARYEFYMKVAKKVSATKLVAIYRHFYPLFQAAYKDLGTDHYFNDRLIEVMNNLLATPEVADPIPVFSPSVRYKYNDAKIEGLTAGQRALIRLGPENAKELKAKIRQIRNLLTRS